MHFPLAICITHAFAHRTLHSSEKIIVGVDNVKKDGNATGFDLGEATYLGLGLDTRGKQEQQLVVQEQYQPKVGRGAKGKGTDNLTSRGDPAMSASQIGVQKFIGHSEAAADSTDQPTDQHEARFKLPFTLMRNSSLLEGRVWAGVPPASIESLPGKTDDAHATVLKILAVTYAPRKLVDYTQKDQNKKGWIQVSPYYDEDSEMFYVTIVKEKGEKKGSRLSKDWPWPVGKPMNVVPQNLLVNVPLRNVKLAREELVLEKLYRSEEGYKDREPKELDFEVLGKASVGTRQYAVLHPQEVLDNFPDLGLLFKGESHGITDANAKKIMLSAIALVQAVRGEKVGKDSGTPIVERHPDVLHSGAWDSVIVRGTGAGKNAKHLHRNYSKVDTMGRRMGCNVWVPISPPMGGDSNKRLLVMAPKDSFKLLRSFSFLFDGTYPDLQSACAEDILTLMVLKPSAFKATIGGMSGGNELMEAGRNAKEALLMTPRSGILVFGSGPPSRDEPFDHNQFGLLHTAWNPDAYLGEPRITSPWTWDPVEAKNYLNFDVHLAVSDNYFAPSLWDLSTKSQSTKPPNTQWETEVR